MYSFNDFVAGKFCVQRKNFLIFLHIQNEPIKHRLTPEVKRGPNISYVILCLHRIHTLYALISNSSLHDWNVLTTCTIVRTILSTLIHSSDSIIPFYLFFVLENNDLRCPQAATAIADAKNPAKYRMINSWWKNGNSLSQFRNSARMSNSLEILSLSLSRDRTLRQNLFGGGRECNFNQCQSLKTINDDSGSILSHQLPSPAPRPGTEISTAASIILSTIVAGFIFATKINQEQQRPSSD